MNEGMGKQSAPVSGVLEADDVGSDGLLIKCQLKIQVGYRACMTIIHACIRYARARFVYTCVCGRTTGMRVFFKQMSLSCFFPMHVTCMVAHKKYVGFLLWCGLLTCVC